MACLKMSVYEMDLNAVQIFVDCVHALVDSVLVCQLPIAVREVSNIKSVTRAARVYSPLCANKTVSTSVCGIQNG